MGPGLLTLGAQSLRPTRQALNIKSINKKQLQGLSWQSRGHDSEVPLQGTQVRSLVGEALHTMGCGQNRKHFLGRVRVYGPTSTVTLLVFFFSLIYPYFFFFNTILFIY